MSTEPGAAHFIDLIEEVEVHEGEEANYSDSYIDKQRISWRRIQHEVDSLPLKRAFVTRSTFGDVPNMKQQVDDLADYFGARGVPFVRLPTPARFYSKDKQGEWNAAFQT